MQFALLSGGRSAGGAGYSEDELGDALGIHVTIMPPLLNWNLCSIAQLESTFSFMLVGMESFQTTEITDEVIRLMDLQVEALKEPLLEMTVGEVHDYDERRSRIGQLCGELGSD